jgi:argininosuccinate lyase
MAEVWRGRLGGLDPRARVLNDSLAVDKRLWPEELALSRAYGESLRECGIMTPAELTALIGACDSLDAELAAGTHKLDGENVQYAVEAELL